LLAESMRHAFADRARWMGDPGFVDVPVSRLLSKEYLDARAAAVHPGKVMEPREYGTAPPAEGTGAGAEDHGTTHVSVVDRWGGAAACTLTVNMSFGSCGAASEYGVLLNGEMDDFTTRRGQANGLGLVQ